MAEPVGAVRREADLEDRVARRGERLDERRARARRCPAAARGCPSPSSPSPSSASLQSMPSLGTPAIVRRSIVIALRRQVRPERREDDEPAGLRDVGRAAHDSCVCEAAASARIRRDRP